MAKVLNGTPPTLPTHKMLHKVMNKPQGEPKKQHFRFTSQTNDLYSKKALLYQKNRDAGAINILRYSLYV